MFESGARRWPGRRGRRSDRRGHRDVYPKGTGIYGSEMPRELSASRARHYRGNRRSAWPGLRPGSYAERARCRSERAGAGSRRCIPRDSAASILQGMTVTTSRPILCDRGRADRVRWCTRLGWRRAHAHADRKASRRPSGRHDLPEEKACSRARLERRGDRLRRLRERAKEITGGEGGRPSTTESEGSTLRRFKARRPMGRMILYGAARPADPLDIGSLGPRHSFYVQRPNCRTYTPKRRVVACDRARNLFELIEEASLTLDRRSTTGSMKDVRRTKTSKRAGRAGSCC